MAAIVMDIVEDQVAACNAALVDMVGCMDFDEALLALVDPDTIGVDDETWAQMCSSLPSNY